MTANVAHRIATWSCLCAISFGLPAAADPEPAPSEAPQEGSPGAGEGELTKVVLEGGQGLQAELLVDDPESVSVEVLNRGLEDARSSTRWAGREEGATAKNGAVWFNDPNRTRYFLVPSAIPLRAGEGYFSQKEVAYTMLTYGLTNNIEIMAGSMIPFWLFPNSIGPHLNVGLKVGFQLHPNFHLALGSHSFLRASESQLLIAFLGTGTIGTDDLNLSLSAAAIPLASSSIASSLGLVVIGASAKARLLPNLALVTENWLFPATTYSSWMVISGGLRIMGDRLALDLGGVLVLGSSSAVYPWVDFTYNFSL